VEFEVLADFVASMLGQLIGEVTGESVETLLERRAVERALPAAVERAERRFALEYHAKDPELATALAAQTRFADLPSVRAALRELVIRPFHDPAASVEVVRRSFDDVLPERLDRARVDAAVAAFLGYLGQEVLYIPQLRELYKLAFQKSAAESSRRIASSAEAIVQGIETLRADLRQLPAPSYPALLTAAAPLERPRPWHNLPQRSYARFVGRQAELEKLTQLLLPHPRSRHFVATLDGIGGVGKSALALELAYRYRDGYASLTPDERFDTIVWVSAKRTLLTASGIQQRQQSFNTLADLYRALATVLDQPAILHADPSQRRDLVERLLSNQRSLLIVDNLETVDDEELLTFLREIPDPTKALVTTRHRIDIAYAIRLSGMPEPDAWALMQVEAERKDVALPPDAIGDLYRRTGGVPLAIVWSIGLMSIGHSIESVLRRLGSGQSDIARFCFAESVARIRDRDAHRVLLALALFERSVGRTMLGEVAGLADDVIGRDDGLAELLQLSLIEQKTDRFFLLPLTQSYVLEELAARPELKRELRERWVDHLVALARPYADLRWRQSDSLALHKEGPHLATAAVWSQRAGRLDVLLRIFPALAAYYMTTGQWVDVLDLAVVALEYAHLIGDRKRVVFIEAHILSWMLRQQGRQEEAERYVADALEVAQQLGNMLWQCDVLIHYSQVLRQRGAYEQALEMCRRASDLLPQIPSDQCLFVRADIDYELGRVARDQQNWAEAEGYFLQAQIIFGHDQENPRFNREYAWSLYSNLGFVKHQRGELEVAAPIYRQALEFFRTAGSKGHMATVLIRLASLEEQRGEPATALEHAHEALEWSRRLDMAQERALAETIVARLEPLRH
jgi:tetratricopeptide (TPR) repeat protein